MPDQDSLLLRPIGTVRSPVTERKKMPVWGISASVEVAPEFEAALHRIEKHSHLWILAWLTMGRDERHVLQVTPRGVSDPGPEGLHGVFSVRSPARPNPIGLTAARVMRREGLTLHLDRLDFLDGTPVLDLKPYFITRDLIFSANGQQVGKPRSREDLRASLYTQALHFHGAAAPDVALAVRLLEHYRLTFHDLNDPGTYALTAPLARPVLLDGLIGITRSTPGRGNLAFHSLPTVVIDGKAEYSPHEELPDDPLQAPDEALFRWRAL
ncbi:MAG: tRNA (N6-threonylcarbamoyladenosine(37)-N6)-methyltransferase TrmO [Acidobacteria bacterium]|nr:tRNA (N6-threonylcarbamoyladenosine(37)-N6)-methyltransferase TrmO [Acidobacteriota bacterium]